MANIKDPFAEFVSKEEADPFAEFETKEMGPAKSEKGDLTDADLKAIAEKHQVSLDKLRNSLPFLGGVTAGQLVGEEGKLPERLAGEASKAFLMGIPQKAFTLAQDKPLRDALDDLRELISEKQTISQKAAELGLGIGATVAGGAALKGAALVGGKLLGLAPKVAETVVGLEGLTKQIAKSGAIYGGLSGAAESRTGEEIQGGLIGAAFGAGVGAALGKGIQLGAKGVKFLGGKQAAEEAARAAKTLDLEVKTRAELAKTVETDSKFVKEISNETTLLDISKKMDSLEEAIKQRTQLLRKMERDGVSTENVKQELDSLIREAASTKETSDSLKSFGSYLAGQSLSAKEAGNQINKVLQTEGPEFLAREHARFRQVEETSKMLFNELDKVIPNTEGFFRRTLLNVRDGKYAQILFDRRLGTEGSLVLDRISENQSRLSWKMASVYEKASKLGDSLNASKLDGDFLGTLLDKAETAEEAIKMGLNPKDAPLFTSFRMAFNNLLTEANQAGIPIKKLKGAYLPHRAVGPAEYASRMNKEIKGLSTQLGKDIREELTPELREKLNPLITNLLNEKTRKETASKNPELSRLLDGLKYVLGKEPENADQLAAALRSINNMDGLNSALQGQARAALSREMQIPEFIQEKNPLKLYMDWSFNTFRHVAFRDEVSELNKIRDMALKVGDKTAVDYYTKLLQDLNGGRAGTLANATRKLNQKAQLLFKKKANESTNKAAKGLYETLGDNPEMLQSVINQIYPNVLGLSPRAALQNLTSPFFMSVPELGLIGGTARTLGAYMKAANVLRRGEDIRLSREMAEYLSQKVGKSFKEGDSLNTRNIHYIVGNRGHLTTQWTSELQNDLRKGISTSLLVSVPKKMLEKYTNAAMYLFQQTESMSRFVASEMGRGIGQDILSLSKAGKLTGSGMEKFIKEMDPAYQRALNDALKTGSEEQVKKLTESYLVSRVALNYNKANMSEFGRTLGPIFSVFSKYPASIAGRVLDVYETKGVIKGTQAVAARMIGPLAAYGMIDYLMGLGAFAPEKEPGPIGINPLNWTPEQKAKVIGRGGLTGQAPIGSLGSLVTGDVLRPPLIQTATEGAKAVATLEPGKLWRWFNNAGTQLFPGGGLVRVLSNDVPIYVTGEKPEGTPLGRSIKAVTGVDVDEYVQELDAQVRDFKERMKE